MDSASNLFARLDLADNFTDSRHEDMDEMDIDLADEGRASSFNPRVGSRRKKHARNSGPGDFGGGGGGSSSARNDDSELQQRRARLVQLINNDLESNDPSLPRNEVLESERNRPHYEAASSQKSPKALKSVSYQNKGSWRKKGKEHFPVFDGGDSVWKPREKREKRERRWAQKGYSCPRNSAKNWGATEVEGQDTDGFADGETCSSYIRKDSKDKMIGIDSSFVSQPRAGQGHQRWSRSTSPPKNTGLTRLAHNGRTFHSKRGWGKNVAKDPGVRTIICSEHLDGDSSHHVVSPHFRSRHLGEEKGKKIMENSVFNGEEDIEAELQSKRSEVAKEALAAADDNAFGSFEDISWRTKASVFPSEESDCVSKGEQATTGHLSDLRHKITMEYEGPVNNVNDTLETTISHRLDRRCILEPESETRSRGSQRRQRFMKGKRECSSICSDYGGSSSSNFENSGMLRIQPSRHIHRNFDSEHYSNIFDPVIELNELQSSEVRRDNLQEQSIRVPDQSSAPIGQLESDEMLARQLQEQFYDEVAGFAGTEEIDASIAWSLQQEDAGLAASTARRPHSDNRREASMAHLYEYYAQLPYRNSSARLSNRTQSQTSNRRRNYYSSERDLETRMMAEVRNFTGMDLGMRRDFLEALEAAFDQSNDTLSESALEIPNDFNEYDYEMLLALDENNHQLVGASETQIDSLPQSVMQADSVEEVCAVCLENPAFGEVIRHLPCLHKFHRDCIDPWLKRRTWCPVCKSDILLNG